MEKEAKGSFELSMAAEETISLKIIVDEEKSQVIFAEPDNDFVNILFSFLTLPMGTIVRLLHKHSPKVEIGCMNKIYESVENCEVGVLRTEACRTMLLWPRNAAEAECENLKLKIDDRESKYYICGSNGEHPWNEQGFKLIISHYKNARCLCGHGMGREVDFSNAKDDDGEVFVKQRAKFMVSDDLHVMPMSTSTCISQVRRSGVEEEITLKERTLNLGVHEVLRLLKCSLISKSPLTDLVFPESPPLEFGSVKLEPRTTIQSRNRREREIERKKIERKKISVKLMIRKSKQEVLYAEVGEDFVDVLFSFLTLPLGCMVELLGGSCSIGCIENLYQSVQDLDVDRYMKSEEPKTMLVSPKLAPDFGCENQPLHLQEAKHPLYYCALPGGPLDKYELTTDPDAPRRYGTFWTGVIVMDPKSNGEISQNAQKPKTRKKRKRNRKTDAETTSGGGFVKGPAMFLVRDDLVVTPISSISVFSLLKELKVLISDVEERLLNLGEDEVLSLLKASLISKTALTALFTLAKPKEQDYEPASTHVSDQKNPLQDPSFN